METAAKTLLHSHLKDPDTALVQRLHLVGPGAWRSGPFFFPKFTLGWKIKFEANSKNSYGAYEGYKDYYVIWRGRALFGGEWEPYDLEVK